MKMSILCMVMVLLVYSITLDTTEAWYGRDDSPELYDGDSSPEEQGYGYGGNRDYNGYGRYRYNGYGGSYDIDDVSIELGRQQIQSRGQRPCGLARMRNGRNKRMMAVCKASLCDTSIAASNFPVNHLCTNCKTAVDAASRMNTLLPILPAFNIPYLLFNDRTYGATSPDISYTDINSGSADKCRITNDVQVWSCKKKSTTNPWTCAPQGFCTADIERASATADYLPKTPKCTCPNSFFDNKHVCASCKDKGGALNHVNRKDSRGNVLLPPTAGNARTVYSGQLTYINDPSSTHLCLVSNPPNDVLSWRCIPKKSNKKQWQDCDNIGYCTEIRSKRTDGHLEYKDNACFKDYDNYIWDGVTCPKLDIITVVADMTGANCMVKCREDYLTDIAKRCNAFNYKAGDTDCELRRCDSAKFPKFPAGLKASPGFKAYYQDVLF